jgi:hypothetical protein
MHVTKQTTIVKMMVTNATGIQYQNMINKNKVENKQKNND